MSDQGPGNPPSDPEGSSGPPSNEPGLPSWEQPSPPSNQPPSWEQPTNQPPSWEQPLAQPPQPPQSQPFQHQGPPADVPDYLVWSILMTVLCCPPVGSAFGVAGIIYSAQANNKKGTGDVVGALKDAATAKKILVIGAIVTGVGTVLATVGYVALIALSFAAETSP